jgi:hypothetical protein
MRTKPTIGPTRRRITLRGKLRGVIRGDKYMVDAYPSDAPGGTAPPATTAKER